MSYLKCKYVDLHIDNSSCLVLGMQTACLHVWVASQWPDEKPKACGWVSVVLEWRHIINEHKLSLLYHRFLELVTLQQAAWSATRHRVTASSSRRQQQWAESHHLEWRSNWSPAEAPGDRTGSSMSGHKRLLCYCPCQTYQAITPLLLININLSSYFSYDQMMSLLTTLC